MAKSDHCSTSERTTHQLELMVGFNSCLSLSRLPHRSNYFSQRILNNHGRRMKKVDLERPRIIPPVLGVTSGLRVFVVSDLHTDYAENMKWVKCLSSINYKNDVLLVAGDVAETYDKFVVTLSLLKERFQHVFFVPGNHDLWCRRDGENYVRSFIMPRQ